MQRMYTQDINELTISGLVNQPPKLQCDPDAGRPTASSS
jgi:hypothetical protein